MKAPRKRAPKSKPAGDTLAARLVNAPKTSDAKAAKRKVEDWLNSLADSEAGGRR